LKAVAALRKNPLVILFSPMVLVTFNEAGQLQRHAVLGAEPKMLVEQ